jgi:hypothetical protein
MVMFRALLLGLSGLAIAAAGGAEAKAPQCRDAKGQSAPCPHKVVPAPTPAPAGGTGGGCLWLMINGSMVPCFVQ